MGSIPIARSIFFQPWLWHRMVDGRCQVEHGLSHGRNTRDFTMEEQIKDKVETLRKMLQRDGGDCEIVQIQGKTVMMRLRGACGTCPHAMATLKGYIEESLRSDVDPDIVVERVQ
ncbi:MAG: NifU family protein [Kiritimatiellia bacterium]